MGQPVCEDNSYTIGWICALEVERAAAIEMLDEVHEPPSGSDGNLYTFGRVGAHNIVIAPILWAGNNNAATRMLQLLYDVPSIRLALLVGIGGGIPVEAKHDIRLGDVVVSNPTTTFGGVIQYDRTLRVDGRFERSRTLNRPPAVLTENLQKFQAQHMINGDEISENLSQMLERYLAKKEEQFFYQGDEHDILYQATYQHKGGNSCGSCDRSKVIDRIPRETTSPRIHYGTIGSTNLVVKDGVIREKIREDSGIICVEMEAYGLVNEFPCLMIRGICDYADSHKNNRWQSYAAATASAYAKKLLSIIPAEEIHATERALHTIQSPRCGPRIMYGLCELNRLSDNARDTEKRSLNKDVDMYSMLNSRTQLEREFSPHVWGTSYIGDWHGILSCVFGICSVATRWMRWQLRRVCVGGTV